MREIGVCLRAWRCCLFSLLTFLWRFSPTSYVACAQAAGFAVLVAGTLVYSKGDQKQVAELREKHAQHRPVRAAFRFFNSIATPSHNSVHLHSWHRAVHRVMSAMHLEEGASH